MIERIDELDPPVECYFMVQKPARKLVGTSKYLQLELDMKHTLNCFLLVPIDAKDLASNLMNFATLMSRIAVEKTRYLKDEKRIYSRNFTLVNEAYRRLEEGSTFLAMDVCDESVLQCAGNADTATTYSYSS